MEDAANVFPLIKSSVAHRRKAHKWYLLTAQVPVDSHLQIQPYQTKTTLT